MKISSFLAAPSRQLVRMCLFYPSYLDNGPPTLNFKQNIVVQNGFHFLLGHCVHQQFLEQREHPHRMQVNDEVGHGRIYIRILFLHGGEPCLDQPGRAVGVAFAKMFQRRTLGTEQQDLQQAAMRFDERNVFVNAGFQVFFGPHHHHVLAAYSVMLL